MIIVDTDVVSELMRPSPSARVLEWLADQPGRELCTTAVTVAEVLDGIERLPAGRAAGRVEVCGRRVFEAFAEQVLAFDAPAVGEYALIVSHRERLGLPVEGFDAQIAAICRVRGAILADGAIRRSVRFSGDQVSRSADWLMLVVAVVNAFWTRAMCGELMAW